MAEESKKPTVFHKVLSPAAIKEIVRNTLQSGAKAGDVIADSSGTVQVPAHVNPVLPALFPKRAGAIARAVGISALALTCFFGGYAMKGEAPSAAPAAESAVTESTLTEQFNFAGKPYRVGDAMPDGSVFAGIVPETGEGIFALPADANVSMGFNAASQYAEDINKKNARGHSDWRIPTSTELQVIARNQGEGGLKGTFHSFFYWSSTRASESSPGYMQSVYFNSGFGLFFNNGDLGTASSAEGKYCRLVRVDLPDAPK